MKGISVSKSKSKAKGLNRIATHKKLIVSKDEQKSEQELASSTQQKNKQNICCKTSNIKKLKGHITLSQSLKNISVVQNSHLKQQPIKESLKYLSNTHFSNIQTIPDTTTQHSYFSQVCINNHKYMINNHKHHQKVSKTSQNQITKGKSNMFEKYSKVFQIKEQKQKSKQLNFEQPQLNLSMFNIQLQQQSSCKEKTHPNVMASSVGELMNKKMFKTSNKKESHLNSTSSKGLVDKLNFDMTPLIQRQLQQNQQEIVKQVKSDQTQTPILNLSERHFQEARLCQTRILSQRTNSLQIQNNQQGQMRAFIDFRLPQKRVNMHLLKNKSSKILFNCSKENISSNYHNNTSPTHQNSLNSLVGLQKTDKIKSQTGKGCMNTSLNKIYSNQPKQFAIGNYCQKKTFKKLLNQTRRNVLQIKDKQLCKQDFVIGKKIGRGRFGNAYIAQHFGTQSIFALKVLDIQQIKDEQMQQQIVSQIKLQSFLSHPNILKLYGFFKDQNKLYLILQLADMCLYKFMKQFRGEAQYEKYFQEHKVAYYAKQMLESMKYFHSENIIHRDIKPQNIMINFSVLKLGDFGWSVYSPTYKRQTFCGTLDYVPPQIIKGEFYDEKVDIWSFGILLYQLFHGFAPFQSENEVQQQTFQKILEGKIKFSERMSQNLKTLIQTILHQNPDRRINLYDINESEWMQSNQKEGRLIDQQIWQSWQQLSK